MERKMLYIGHMSRKNSLNLTKTFVQGKLEEKRGKGRPLTSYVYNIEKWTGLSTQGEFQATHDRKVWRKKTRKAVQAANTQTQMDEATKK